MIIFGWQEKKINMLSVQDHSCNNCNAENSLCIQVNKSYLHVFRIPFIPLAKKVYSVCKHCKQSLNENELPPDLQTKSYKIKKNTKTPWWYYLGLSLLGLTFLPIASSIILHIFK